MSNRPVAAQIARPATPPVLIVGMHRSGTSLIAHMLNALGLHLGAPTRLMPAQADNPDGFFENIDVVMLHEEMLEEIQSAWDLPPALTVYGQRAHWGGAFSARAIEITGRIAAGAQTGSRWGFKDPRLCLTLPFWLDLFPQAQVVLCMRDPFAVAQSLCKRNGFSMRHGLTLIEHYLRQLELGVSLLRVKAEVVLLEDLVADPGQAAEKLSRVLWRPTCEPFPAQKALEVYKPDQIHHHSLMPDRARWEAQFPSLPGLVKRLTEIARAPTLSL